MIVIVELVMPSEIPEVMLFEGPVIEGDVSSISAIETVTVWSAVSLPESVALLPTIYGLFESYR